MAFNNNTMNSTANLQQRGESISYKSEDAKYAKRLKRDLQSYRLPTRLRKQYRLASSHCSPVFLDKTNLTPGLLDEGLRREVQESRFLIVICSRHAHDRSRHLDDELKFFLEGGGDRSHILPFIVDESDNAVEECFPKALQELCRTQDIVGANIHDDGWRTAVIKLIASMLGIKRVELEAEDRKRTLVKRVTAAALMTSMLVVGMLCWNYFRPTLKYYIDYTGQTESRLCVNTDLPEWKMSMMREAMGPRQVTME